MLVRILAIIVCGVGGYFAAGAFHSPSAAGVSGPAELASVVEMQLPTAAESAFIGEWETLRATHGDDSAAMYEAIKDTPDDFRRRAFRSALIGEWSVRDPHAALAYLLEKDPNNAGQLVREWLRRDPEGAITGLLAGGDKAVGRLRSVLGDIARLAPSRLVEVVAALKKPDGRWDSSTADAFAIFAAKDPEAARAAAESVTGELRGQALAGVAKAWAERDGDAALAWAQAMPAGDARDMALKAALVGWAKTDPVAALGKLDLVPPGGEEMHYASDVGAQVLREAAKKDWDGTIAWLRDNPGKLGRASFDGLQNELSRRLGVDTAGTMRLVATSGLPGLQQVFANAILNDGYAQRDAIWSWLDGQPPGELTRDLRGALLNAIAWKEPDAALRFLDRIPDTAENAELFERGVLSLFNGGSLVNLAEGLLDKASERIRPRLIEAALNYGGEIIGNDPARWIERLNEIPADRRGGSTARIAGSWAAIDPEAAVRWASALPDATTRDDALGSIAGIWVANDPPEAEAWADSLPAGKGRDIAARSIANRLSATRPENAWEWALSIQSPGERSGALQLAYLGLMRKDPAIAEQMLTGTNVPPAEIKALRDYYKPGMETQFFPR